MSLGRTFAAGRLINVPPQLCRTPPGAALILQNWNGAFPGLASELEVNAVCQVPLTDMMGIKRRRFLKSGVRDLGRTTPIMLPPPDPCRFISFGKRVFCFTPERKSHVPPPQPPAALPGEAIFRQDDVSDVGRKDDARAKAC